MTTPALAFAIEGRPSIGRLQEQLGRARLVNANLREKLHAEQSESAAFAELVRVGVVDIRESLVTGDERRLEQSANAIGYAAARHVAQRSSSVL